MYENYYHQGRSLRDWQKATGGQYSLGELYRMAKDGCDFGKVALRDAGISTLED